MGSTSYFEFAQYPSKYRELAEGLRTPFGRERRATTKASSPVRKARDVVSRRMAAGWGNVKNELNILFKDLGVSGSAPRDIYLHLALAAVVVYGMIIFITGMPSHVWGWLGLMPAAASFVFTADLAVVFLAGMIEGASKKKSGFAAGPYNDQIFSFKEYLRFLGGMARYAARKSRRFGYHHGFKRMIVERRILYIREAVAQLHVEQIIGLLVRDPSEAVRMEAAQWFGERGEKGHIREILDWVVSDALRYAADYDTDAAVRQKAQEALYKIERGAAERAMRDNRINFQQGSEPAEGRRRTSGSSPISAEEAREIFERIVAVAKQDSPRHAAYDFVFMLHYSPTPSPWIGKAWEEKVEGRDTAFIMIKTRALDESEYFVAKLIGHEVAHVTLGHTLMSEPGKVVVAILTAVFVIFEILLRYSFPKTSFDLRVFLLICWLLFVEMVFLLPWSIPDKIVNSLKLRPLKEARARRLGSRYAKLAGYRRGPPPIWRPKNKKDDTSSPVRPRKGARSRQNQRFWRIGSYLLNRSMKSLAVTMGMPEHDFNISKSSSPVTIKSAPASAAASRSILSFASRQSDIFLVGTTSKVSTLIKAWNRLISSAWKYFLRRGFLTTLKISSWRLGDRTGVNRLSTKALYILTNVALFPITALMMTFVSTTAFSPLFIASLSYFFAYAVDLSLRNRTFRGAASDAGNDLIPSLPAGLSFKFFHHPDSVRDGKFIESISDDLNTQINFLLCHGDPPDYLSGDDYTISLQASQASHPISEGHHSPRHSSKAAMVVHTGTAPFSKDNNNPVRPARLSAKPRAPGGARPRPEPNGSGRASSPLDFSRAGRISLEAFVEQSALVDDDSWAGAGTEIGPGVRVINSVLAEDVEAGAGAFIEDSVILGGARIGEGAVISGALVEEGAVIAPFSRVAGAFVGAGYEWMTDGTLPEHDLEKLMEGIIKGKTAFEWEALDEKTRKAAGSLLGFLCAEIRPLEFTGCPTYNWLREAYRRISRRMGHAGGTGNAAETRIKEVFQKIYENSNHHRRVMYGGEEELSYRQAVGLVDFENVLRPVLRQWLLRRNGEGKSSSPVRQHWQEPWAFAWARWFERYFYELWEKMLKLRKKIKIRDLIVFNVPEDLKETGYSSDAPTLRRGSESRSRHSILLVGIPTETKQTSEPSISERREGQGSRDSGQENITRTTKYEGRRTNSPVGAVVQVSVEAKGSPLEHDWYRFYTNKLDPLTPNHEKYFPWFVANFMDPDKADWQEFRQQVEADPRSPWQAVLVKVRDMEGGGPVAIQAQSVTGGIQFSASTYFAD